MLLQPTDVPSRSGINAAITSTMDDHTSLTNPNGLHYDSGWINIVLRSGYQSSGETPAYRRIGSVIYMRGRVLRTTAGNWTTTAVAVGDLPAGFRPSTSNILFAEVIGSAAAASMGRMFVTSSGVINVNTVTGTSDALANAFPLTAAFPN